MRITLVGFAVRSSLEHLLGEGGVTLTQQTAPHPDNRALLVTLIALLSSTEAASSGKKQVVQLDSDIGVLSLELAKNEDGKRFLRGELEDTVGEDADKLDADDEERAIMVKINGSLNKLKTKYDIWKTNRLTPRFEALVKEGKDLAAVKQMYRIGEWGTPSRNKRFYRLFEQWFKQNYPNGLP